MRESRFVVRRATARDQTHCNEIRRIVFTEGLGVSESIEDDGNDDVCEHAIAWVETAPIGTARLRVHDGNAKVERVAVLENYRGMGVGARLMDVLENLAAADGHAAVCLHAQVAVVGFYERLGYLADGPRFLEADIWHQSMYKPLG